MVADGISSIWYYIMKDYLGTPIKVGDYIVYNYSRNYLKIAKVIEVAEWRVKVQPERGRPSWLKHSSILILSQVTYDLVHRRFPL